MLNVSFVVCDPTVWTGRALQAESSEWVASIIAARACRSIWTAGWALATPKRSRWRAASDGAPSFDCVAVLMPLPAFQL